MASTFSAIVTTRDNSTSAGTGFEIPLSTSSDKSTTTPESSAVVASSTTSAGALTTPSTTSSGSNPTAAIAAVTSISSLSSVSNSSSSTDGSPYPLSNSTLSSTISTANSSMTSWSPSTTSPGVVSSVPATSATSTPGANNQTSLAETSSSWLTTPTFAGAVAGSFVAGAFIAGLLVFALSRKRFKRSKSEQHIDRSSYSSSHDLAYIGEKRSPMVTVTTLVEPSFLPQQAEDAEVKRRILSLTDQIDQHVEYFYHNRKIEADRSIEKEIAYYETRQMPNSLAACFELATHPSALIKHCLAFHIFSRTIAPGEDVELILPTDIAGMVSAMYNKCLSPNTPRDMTSAFSLWKNLTGYLRAGEDTKKSRNTSGAAIVFAKQFGKAFSAWSDAQYSEEHRNHHLAALVDDAIDTGVWLFQQPDNYKFSWNMLSYSGRNSTANTFARETVIVPEVSKMTHKGEPLGGQGQSIVQAVVKSF